MYSNSTTYRDLTENELDLIDAQALEHFAVALTRLLDAGIVTKEEAREVLELYGYFGGDKDEGEEEQSL